jgi:hypothetical protein
LLVFIITPLSNGAASQVNNDMQNGQGWASVAFWGAALLVFVIAKFILWDILN